MAKRPPIPFALIETLYDEEDAIIAGFMRVALRMIARGIIEKPLEANVKQMACLDSKVWDKHGDRLKTLLELFYEPMIEHWNHFSHKRVQNQKKARSSVNKWNRLNEMLKRHVTTVTELTVKDVVQEFSRQPTKLERTTRHNEAPISPHLMKKSTKSPFKPGLKDT